jgi:hypothetical protein
MQQPPQQQQQQQHQQQGANVIQFVSFVTETPVDCTREQKRGKYHCTVDLLFDLFGLVCFANKNKNCQLSYS